MCLHSVNARGEIKQFMKQNFPLQFFSCTGNVRVKIAIYNFFDRVFVTASVVEILNFSLYEMNTTRTSSVILHNDFLKYFIDLKSSQSNKNITRQYPALGLDVNHIIHSSLVFSYHMLRNTHSIHYTVRVGGCAICISNKVEYLDKEGSYKTSTRAINWTLNFDFNNDFSDMEF